MTYDWQLPFSRMCLSIVISQFIYILYYFGSRRTMVQFNTFDQTKEGIAAFAICTLAGYLLHLLVEAPFSNLLTELMSSRKETKKVNNKFDDDRIRMKDENSNLISNLVQKELIDEKKIN